VCLLRRAAGVWALVGGTLLGPEGTGWCLSSLVGCWLVSYCAPGVGVGGPSLVAWLFLEKCIVDASIFERSSLWSLLVCGRLFVCGCVVGLCG